MIFVVSWSILLASFFIICAIPTSPFILKKWFFHLYSLGEPDGGCLRVVSVDVTNARGRLFPHGSCGCIARQTDGYPRFIRFPGNSSREIPFDRTPPCSDREEFVKTINLLRRRPFRHLKVKKLRTVISTGSNDFYFVSTDLREQNA